MDYKAYLESYFTSYTVSEEANFNYTGGTILIVKYLGGGQNYVDSVIQPVQIVAHTDDVKTTLSALATFAQTNSGTFLIEDNEYIRQLYSTPVVLSTFNPGHQNYASQVILNGTLIISDNIADIKTVKIDDFEYFTTKRDLVYQTLQDTQVNAADYIADTDIKGAMLQFIVSMENKNNDICNKVSRIRQGQLDSNTEFDIDLTFSNNDTVETYPMKLHSATISSDTALSPIITMTFIK